MTSAASTASSVPATYRVLVVDDNESIRDDFVRILRPAADSAALDRFESELFGGTAEPTQRSRLPALELTLVPQGRDALARVTASVAESRPFALAFVDMRMPPGWDGLETVAKLWNVDPGLEIVLCTAYSDYSWDEIAQQLSRPDRWLMLRKPFEPSEIVQLTCSLAARSARRIRPRT